jgi:uncharacterized membrane protein YGL010W
MRQLFIRQLAAYAQYHRDPHNCATHFVGIPMLFLAAMLPLEALRVQIGHLGVPLSVLMTLPAMMGWIALDLGVGATLSLLLCPLLVTAALIDKHGLAVMWCTTAVLFMVGWFFQLLGHAVFEGRKPAFMDDLSHTLIGPMFVVAKLLVGFGLRRDLQPFLCGAQPISAPPRS